VEAAQLRRPLQYLILGLPEDYLKRLLIDGVFNHGDEHLEYPRKLLTIPMVERSVFLKMLVEGIKNGSEVSEFSLTVACAILSEGIST
jgi:hypothetical protein